MVVACGARGLQHMLLGSVPNHARDVTKGETEPKRGPIKDEDGCALPTILRMTVLLAAGVGLELGHKRHVRLSYKLYFFSQ
jgi:hypothetical protein